jgi:gas vesicle protein
MDKSFFIGIMIGAAVGAAVGLIYAPAPGVEIRHDIASKSKHTAKRIGAIAHTVAEKASGVEERIKQAI